MPIVGLFTGGTKNVEVPDGKAHIPPSEDPGGNVSRSCEGLRACPAAGIARGAVRVRAAGRGTAHPGGAVRSLGRTWPLLLHWGERGEAGEKMPHGEPAPATPQVDIPPLSLRPGPTEGLHVLGAAAARRGGRDDLAGVIVLGPRSSRIVNDRPDDAFLVFHGCNIMYREILCQLKKLIICFTESGALSILPAEWKGVREDADRQWRREERLPLLSG